MKKKLIFFAYDLNIGGIENALVNLLDNINYDKYKVTLILEKKEGLLLEKLNKNVTLKEYRISNNRLVLFRKVFNLSKRIIWSFFNRNKYDFSCCYATYSLMGEKLSKIASKNSSIYIHSDYTLIYKNEKEFKEFFDKRKINDFKTVFFVSNEAKDNFLRKYPLTNNKIVFNNFVDYRNIIDLSKEEITEEKKGKLFVFVGRLDENSKKISRLLNVLKDLNNKDIFLWVVGDGPDRKRYEEYCKNNNLEKNVSFLGMKKNPYPYMSMADYIILTSEYEGFPVIYLEAIALNKKIITTIDVSDEYVKIKDNYGYIISKEIEEMKKEISEILEHDNLEYNPLDFEKMNKEKIRKMERVFDEVI